VGFEDGKIIAVGKTGVSGYYVPLFTGLVDGFRGHDVTVDVQYLSTHDCLDYFRTSGVDGLILVATPTHEQPVLTDLFDAHVPFVAVSVSSPLLEHKHLPCVDTANYAGGQIAARHLLDLGHTRLACVNLGNRFINLTDRMEGFRNALMEAGLPITDDDVVLDFDYTQRSFETLVESWLHRKIALDEVPTGIFSCDYPMALATLNVLRRNGIDVPSHVSVIGFDDPTEAAEFNPPLTTVKQSVYEMAHRAAQRLVAVVDDPSKPRDTCGIEIFPTELVVRESTQRIAVN